MDKSILGEIVKQPFTVIDGDNIPVTGLLNGDFTSYLVDASENSSLITVSVSAVGQGHYIGSYTPDVIGTWFLTIYNSTYFPWGKSGETEVSAYDIDSIGDDVTTLGVAVSAIGDDVTAIGVDVKRLLGLSQEDYYLDQVVWNSFSQMTSGRIRVYSDSASVGSSVNVLSTYTITATYSSASQLIDYKVIRS